MLNSSFAGYTSLRSWATARNRSAAGWHRFNRSGLRGLDDLDGQVRKRRITEEERIRADVHRQPADYGTDMCTPFEESSSGYLPLKQSGLLLGRLAEPKHGRLVRRIKAVGAVGRTRFRDG